MILFISLFLAFILLIWFKTEAFLEYVQLLGLDDIHPSVSTFLQMKAAGVNQSDFITHLATNHDSFFVRLITCPKCLSTWLGGIAAVIFVLPAMATYGIFAGVATVSAIPYLTYLAFQIISKQ